MPSSPPPREPTRPAQPGDDAARLLRAMVSAAAAAASVSSSFRPLAQPDANAARTSALPEPAWQSALVALARHEVRLSVELDRAPVGGNSTRVLIDGEQAYAAMFEAIGAARDHINIESYTIEAEGPGEELANLLSRKSASGVRVNMIYDSWGSWQTSGRYFERLRRAGVSLCEFNPILPWRNLVNPIAWSFNLRDHRKLLIVDGRAAFTGGVNISSVYSSGSSATRASAKQAQANARDPNAAHWRDTHVRVEGPVVAQLQQLFLDQWRLQTGCPVAPAHYFPQLHAVGGQRIAVAARGAGERRGRFYPALLGAIEEARSRIFITVGYFVPTRRLMRSLVAAAQRGVDVRLVLPGFSDVPAAVHAGRSHYGRLLAAGARIFEHCDALLHAKTIVIDGAWATIGSHNMDWRSFVHNAECNVIVVNTGFARHLEQLFDADVVACKEVTLEQWRRRSRWLKAKEWMARQVEYLL
jgi:cardiolipin synthase A/B